MMRFCQSILVIFFGFALLQAEELGFGGKNGMSFADFKREKIEVVHFGSDETRLELSKKKFTPSELFLDFENAKASDLKDNNSNYEVLSAIYTVVDGKSFLGKRYASFSTRNSQVVVSTNNSRILNSSHLTVPFYFSFFLMPGDLAQNASVFSKTYITTGKKYGIECRVTNNHLEVDFYNMYAYSGTETMSFSLSSPDKLKSRDWTHVVVKIDPNGGLVTLYEDGTEKSSFLAIYSKEEPTPLPMGFHSNDTTPLFIGKNFYGKLDNFYIGEGVPKIDNLLIPYKEVEYQSEIQFANQLKGIAQSPVISSKYTHSIPISLDVKIDEPKGTHSEIFYRFSNSLFYEDDHVLPWRRKEDFNEEAKNKNLDFKYFQWKVILRSDYMGKSTPSINKLKVVYKESLPPKIPVGLRISKKKFEELNVCLEWNSNHEENVINGGGYIIYYGVRPDRMVGMLFWSKDGKPIAGFEGKSINDSYKSLEKCLNNDLILYNAEFTKEKNLLTFQKGLTYYFKISAYNKNYDPDISRDQKSGLSEAVLYTFKNDND